MVSRQAHRIIKIETTERGGFNLRYHNELVEILEMNTNFDETLNSYGAGIIDISEEEFPDVKEELEKVIERLETAETEQEDKRGKAQSYRKILAEMEKEITEEGYISYQIY